MSTVDYQSEYVDGLLDRLDAAVADLSQLSLGSLGHADLDRLLSRSVGVVSQAQGVEQ